MKYQFNYTVLLLLLLLTFLQSSDSKYGYGSKTTTKSSKGYGGSTSSKGYGGSSSSGYGGSSSSSYGSNSYGGGYSSGYSKSQPTRKIPLYLAVFLMIFVSAIGMICTAYSFIYNSEGMYANCCRVTVSFGECLRRVGISLYACELSNIPQLIFSFEGEDDEDVDANQMKLRPGIERALEVEHRKAMDRVDLEMQGIKIEKGAPGKKQRFDAKSMKKMKVRVKK